MTIKHKTIKISEFDMALLARTRNDIQAKTKNRVTLGEAIHVACSWRTSLIIQQNNNDNKIRFSIAFSESDKDMMPFEVGYYKIIESRDEKYLVEMIDPARVVIHDENIRIVYDYPLSHMVERVHEKTGGFTRMDLFKIIGDDYATIYQEEQASMKNIKKAPFDNPKPDNIEAAMLSQVTPKFNRGLSDGIHGIFGHDLKDLFLEGLEYNLKTKVLTLMIGS